MPGEGDVLPPPDLVPLPAPAAAPVNNVNNLNIVKSTRVQIGPKFTTVTQNVNNEQLVKDECVCRWRGGGRGGRCATALLISWVLLIAAGLTVYFVFLLSPAPSHLDLGLRAEWYVRRAEWQALPAAEEEFLELPLPYVIVGHSGRGYCDTRHACAVEVRSLQEDYLGRMFNDIGPSFLVGGNGYIFEELPLSKYLWDLAKNSSPTERAACLATVAVVVSCVALVACLVQRPSTDLDSVDEPRHEWYISREMWLAQSFTDESSTEPFEPLMLVVVQHTVSNECRRFVQCAAELRNMQAYFIRSFDYDIPYNFIVGNDGRVYEGRGWGVVGAHTRGYNRCSLGIGFIGDYREELGRYTRVTAEQLERARQLLAEGVRMGRLRADHLVVGARDLQSSASPGSNLYNALRQWPNYDRRNRFKHLTCEQMHDRYAHERL